MVPLCQSTTTSAVLIFNRQKVICGFINSVQDIVIPTWSQLSDMDMLSPGDGVLKPEMDVKILRYLKGRNILSVHKEHS